ncbi:hypothetical protein EMIHUDRAFT_257726, partial [Emiliania huxleyi CCMP1516]|uniref:Aminotransferase class V domain-containing protein n=2 Tax=Emiliania huxleyi TaxID=2903 RepID=A0A0D3IGK3_EMIH1
MYSEPPVQRRPVPAVASVPPAAQLSPKVATQQLIWEDARAEFFLPDRRAIHTYMAAARLSRWVAPGRLGGTRRLSTAPVMSIAGQSRDGKAIYLDSQATTPMDPRVLDAMLPFLSGQFGNPHSKTHEYGWEAESASEAAREQVASLVGADSKEIVFTSGATESNNMAIKGIAHFYGEKKRHIITTQTEHKCVLDSCRVLQQEGFEVDYLPVKQDGLALVSVMYVNNEIGVIQPVREIGQLCRENKVFFHSDPA